MALYDTAKAHSQFTPGVYVTNGESLWRILDLPEEQRKGELPLEDCYFPGEPPIWREIKWLTEHKCRVVRP